MPEAVRSARADRLLSPGFTRLLVAQACFGYAFSSYFLLPKFLVTQLHAGPAEIGRVTALYGLFVVVCLPAMGVVVDRFGRRDFLTAGALVMAAASLAFVAVDRVGPLLFALRAVQGIAFAMAFVAGATLAVDEAPPERLGQALGIFGLTFLAMNAIAPAASEEIALRAGWPATFVVAAVLALVSAGLSRRLQECRAAPARVCPSASVRAGAAPAPAARDGGDLARGRRARRDVHLSPALRARARHDARAQLLRGLRRGGGGAARGLRAPDRSRATPS
jgi:MFS family permease